MRVSVFIFIRIGDLNLFAFQISLRELTDQFGESAELPDSTKSYVSR